MPGRLRLQLSEVQRRELVAMRDHARLPYLRERAAALLKVADGWSATKTAQQGLLKPRNRETVGAWVHRYQQDGLPGLHMRKGRGRKPAYFPALPRS
jgi:hypothetical protein